MRLFKLLLFFVIPSLIFHPLQSYERPSYHEIIGVFQKDTALIKRITVDGIPHFDLIISLIEDIENDNIDEDIDIQELNEFLVLILRFGFRGTQEEWEALERDNKALLEGTYGDDEDDDEYYEEDDLSFIYDYSYEIVLCGGIIKKGAKAVKKTGKTIKKGAKNTYGFVKDHKKEAIIIATSVVAVVILGTVVLPALGGAAAAALDSSSSDHKKHDSNPSKVEALSDSSHVYAAIQEPHARDIVQEHIQNLREEINAEPSIDPDPSILDKARELGSYIAHQVLDGASEVISQLPDAIDTVKEFEGQIIPNGGSHMEQNHSKEKFENLITKGHEIIDDAFSTDLAKHFSHEEQETSFENQFDIGILPPPASGFYGKKGWELKKPKFQPKTHTATNIDGRLYSGHALDQMQNRGIPPSVVENTIKNGEIVNINKNIGTIEYYDSINKIKIVLNEKMEVVTAIRMDKVN